MLSLLFFLFFCLHINNRYQDCVQWEHTHINCCRNRKSNWIVPNTGMHTAIQNIVPRHTEIDYRLEKSNCNMVYSASAIKMKRNRNFVWIWLKYTRQSENQTNSSCCECAMPTSIGQRRPVDGIVCINWIFMAFYGRFGFKCTKYFFVDSHHKMRWRCSHSSNFYGVDRIRSQLHWYFMLVWYHKILFHVCE